MSSWIAIDTETTGPCFHHGCRAFAVSMCDQSGDTYYWECPVNPKTRIPEWSKQSLKEIKDILKAHDTWVFHNALFDMRALSFLPGIGDWVQGRLRKVMIHDTMLAAHVLDSSGPKGLKDLAVHHLDILDDDEKDLDTTVKSLRTIAKKLGWCIAEENHPHMAGIDKGFHKMDMWLPKAIAKHQNLPAEHHYQTVCQTYAVKDAIRTAGLFVIQQNSLNELKEPYTDQLNTLLPFFDMENHGFYLLDSRFLSEIDDANQTQSKYHSSMQRILNTNFGIEEFNPNSHLQLKKVLFEQFKFKSESQTKAGSPSTDKSALPKLKLQTNTYAARRFVDSLISYREVSAALRYLNSYKRYQKGFYLYPNVHIVGTSTTRISMSNPNGQNIGKGKERVDDEGNLLEVEYSIRKVFGPPKGYKWLDIDYDQLQIRIFAYWSKEPVLIKAIEDGFDFHDTVAKMIFETDTITKAQRKVAKYVNFGIIFGAGSNKIDSMCGIPGTHAKVLKLFPNVADALNRTGAFVRKRGYVETASGYRLRVPKHKPYAGVNYIVQGTEGDIVKRAITQCHRITQHSSTKMVLQVHDELIFQYPEQDVPPLRQLLEAMEESGSYYGINCECKPEIILSDWASGKSITADYFDPKSN